MNTSTDSPGPFQRGRRVFRRLRPRTRSRRRDERGAAGVEFLVVATVLIFLFTTLVQYGIRFHAQRVAEAAARPYRLEGAVIVDGLDPDWESGGAQDRPRAFCSADAAAHCDAWCYFWRGCAAVTPVGAARLVFFLDIMGFRSAVESFPADVFDRCVR